MKSLYDSSLKTVLKRPWNLILKNPCIDTDYVNIVSDSGIDEFTYTIHIGEQKFSHEPFRIATSPFEHDLCGTIKYEGRLDGFTLTEEIDIEPVCYFPEENEFKVETIDMDLDGETREISVYATLTDYQPVDYPGVTTTEEMNNLYFDSNLAKYGPCILAYDYFFSTVPQIEPTVSDYAPSSEVEWTLNKLPMYPGYCPVDYECVSVSKKELMDGFPEPLSCEDLVYDFVYDGDAEDGKLTF